MVQHNIEKLKLPKQTNKQKKNQKKTKAKHEEVDKRIAVFLCDIEPTWAQFLLHKYSGRFM